MTDTERFAEVKKRWKQADEHDVVDYRMQAINDLHFLIRRVDQLAPPEPAADKKPRELLQEYADRLEPNSVCCNKPIEWYYATGFGASWRNADYGRCSGCGSSVDRDGCK